ncbi:MAG: hypothetical protein Tsb002_37950 [Wenzhouxiangellaceae bacterium]
MVSALIPPTAADATNDEVYYQINAMDARGNVTEAMHGNGVVTSMSYDADDGQLNHIQSQRGSQNIQYLDYEYDLIGNLQWRHDQSGTKDLYERFVYDGLNRLTQTHFNLNGQGEMLSETVGYDAAGNIQSKNGVSYTYGHESSAANCNVGPHAVCSKGGVGYQYDVTGNVISDDTGRSIDYSVFHKPTEISSGNNLSSTHYWYGAERGRYLRIDSDGTTYYLGNVEYTIKADGSTSIKRYLGGFAIQDIDALNGGKTQQYTHKDHLGSLDVTTSPATGSVVTITGQFSFSSWGQRRNASDWRYTEPNLNALREITPRGYTGHEHIDHAGIIHMNGRIYDPELGRFLQADPMVQAPENSQNLNRYSYVLNNPLSYTDPSGYFFKAIGKFFKRYGRTLAAIGIGVLTSGIASGAIWSSLGIAGTSTGFAVAVAGGALAGYVSTGSLKGALFGAFSAAAFYGVGETFQSAAKDNITKGISVSSKSGLTFGQRLAKTITHAAVGGTMQELNGGKFGHGFASAGVTQAFGGYISDVGGNNFGGSAARISLAAVVGGTASELTGGKFTNGAVTGAFSRAFNDEIEDNIVEESRKAFKAELDRLKEEGVLSAARVFKTEDEAAAEVLSVTAPLSKQFGLEVGGNIIPARGGFRYTFPEIGGVGSVGVSQSYPGYHTHPVGPFKFSNRFFNHSNDADGGDANWVIGSNNPLYLGVQVSGVVKIGICEPGSCSNAGFRGTEPSRVINE